MKISYYSSKVLNGWGGEVLISHNRESKTPPPITLHPATHSNGKGGGWKKTKAHTHFLIALSFIHLHSVAHNF